MGFVVVVVRSVVVVVVVEDHVFEDVGQQTLGCEPDMSQVDSCRYKISDWLTGRFFRI